MRDVTVPLLTFAGGLLVGFVPYLLTRRSERADRRAAARLIAAEFVENDAIIRIAADAAATGVGLRGVPRDRSRWEEYEPLLARLISDQATWVKVEAAAGAIKLFDELARADPDMGQEAAQRLASDMRSRIASGREALDALVA